jgi:primase-polymerase (primpol)-like protein
MALPIEDLFRDMAAEWMGWAGQKTWSDLENSVEIVATSDKTGHISLRITLNGQDGDTQLRTCLKFEAGQLENFAEEVARLFK